MRANTGASHLRSLGKCPQRRGTVIWWKATKNDSVVINFKIFGIFWWIWKNKSLPATNNYVIAAWLPGDFVSMKKCWICMNKAWISSIGGVDSLREHPSIAQFAQCRQIKMNFKSCQFFIGNRSFTCIGQNSPSETKSCLIVVLNWVAAANMAIARLWQ